MDAPPPPLRALVSPDDPPGCACTSTPTRAAAPAAPIRAADAGPGRSSGAAHRSHREPRRTSATGAEAGRTTATGIAGRGRARTASTAARCDARPETQAGQEV